MDKVQAADVLDKTRNWFKGGFKASNKVRFIKGTENMVPESEQRAKSAFANSISQLPNEEFANGMISAMESLKNVGVSSQPNSTKTLLSGAMIVNKGVKSGNCADYAATALFIARRDYQATGYAVKLTEGDHVFALFPPAKTALSKLKNWSTLTDSFAGISGDTWIVDGWANIVCKPNEYLDKFKEQMGEWTKVNKRILWKPRNSPKDATGLWTSPLEAKYLEEISTSRLDWAS